MAVRRLRMLAFPNLPDDGTLTVSPTMSLVDMQAKVAGGANVWVEFEIWLTLEFAD